MGGAGVGWYTEVGKGAGIDAAISVLFPILALMCFSPLSLLQACQGGVEAQGGMVVEGGAGGGIDAATSVLVPILAFWCLLRLVCFERSRGGVASVGMDE